MLSVQFALTSACVNGWGAKIIISRRLRSLARTRPIARDNGVYGRIGLFRSRGRRQRKMQRRCRVAALSTFVHPRFTLLGVNFFQKLTRWVNPRLQTWAAVLSCNVLCRLGFNTRSQCRAEGAPLARRRRAVNGHERRRRECAAVHKERQLHGQRYARSEVSTRFMVTSG